jgi:hypothetical protein
LSEEPDDFLTWPADAGADGAFISPGCTGFTGLDNEFVRIFAGLPFFIDEMDLGLNPLLGPSWIFVFIFFILG